MKVQFSVTLPFKYDAKIPHLFFIMIIAIANQKTEIIVICTGKWCNISPQLYRKALIGKGKFNSL